MSYKIIPTQRFEKELKRLAKKYPSLKNEFKELIELILENPESGIFIGNNCFKIRLSIKSKGKGKSGGARVLTYFYIENEKSEIDKENHKLTDVVYLLTIYDKSEKESIKPNELKEMIESLELEG